LHEPARFERRDVAGRQNFRRFLNLPVIGRIEQAARKVGLLILNSLSLIRDYDDGRTQLARDGSPLDRSVQQDVLLSSTSSQNRFDDEDI
jgi:hypothetical protein